MGAWGEEKAREFLAKEEYTILAQNYHSRFGEIDIIARKDNIVCFIEVKTRKYNSLYAPVEAVSFAKQEKLILTAQIYLAEQNFVEDLAYRFDIMEVVYYNSYIFEINHLKGAFEL